MDSENWVASTTRVSELNFMHIIIISCKLGYEFHAHLYDSEVHNAFIELSADESKGVWGVPNDQALMP